MTLFEIPLSGAPQRFNISLAGTVYSLTFLYRDAPMGGWCLDINDNLGNPLVCGIPLITGADLLAQYAYLNFGGAMVIFSDGNKALVPTFDNLGSGSHLYWVTP